MPQGAGIKKRAKMWLDFQNDVKVSDVQLAAREGYDERRTHQALHHARHGDGSGKAQQHQRTGDPCRHAERTDPAGGHHDLPPALHAHLHGRHRRRGAGRGVPAAPPHGPFKPATKRPARSGSLSASGGGPYCFPKPGEARRDAVNREITATRSSVGLLDASTLGKILVKGPDAGRFTDMLYTNMMSTLESRADAAMG